MVLVLSAMTIIHIYCSLKCRYLQEKLPCSQIGAVLKKDGTRHQMAAMLNENVVDCIGAGDSFNSGFISQLVQGASLEDCQRYGNMTGAVNTTAAGGTTAFTCLEDVERIAKERFGFVK